MCRRCFTVPDLAQSGVLSFHMGLFTSTDDATGALSLGLNSCLVEWAGFGLYFCSCVAKFLLTIVFLFFSNLMYRNGELRLPLYCYWRPTLQSVVLQNQRLVIVRLHIAGAHYSSCFVHFFVVSCSFWKRL